MIKGLFILNILLLSFSVIASDVVPYTVKSIQPIGAGFVELVGPGKTQINGETIW